MIGYWIALASAFAAGVVVTLLATERRRADVREQLAFVHRWEEQGLQPARHWAELRTAAYRPALPANSKPFDVDAAVRSMGLGTRIVWHLSQPRYDWLLGWVNRLRKTVEPVPFEFDETVRIGRHRAIEAGSVT